MEFDHPDLLEMYERDGFVSPIRVMSLEEAAAVRSRLERVEGERGGMHYVVKPYLLMSWVMDIAKRPEILGAVRRVLGDDLLLWDAEFIIKEPGGNLRVDWHQDLMYFGLDADDLVTAWVAISPATRGNGGMQFERGSHKSGMYDHVETYSGGSVLTRGQRVVAEVNEDRVIDAVLSAGEMSLHHGATFHASAPNVTEDRRIGLCLLYIKPSVKQVCADWDSATLVSGTDRYRHFAQEEHPDFDFSPRAVEYQAMVDARRKALWREATPANLREYRRGSASC